MSDPAHHANTKPNLLVLCTGNSCRSQIAEGFFRAYAGDRFDVYSAGTQPARAVHPLAVRVMAELGMDIARQQPKGLDQYLGRLPMQYLVVVCDGANAQCPGALPGTHQRIFWPFDDPARFEGSPEQTLQEFRRVRDQIRQRIVQWLETENPQE